MLSIHENYFCEAIIASCFPAAEVLVHMGVTLFGRRPNGAPGFCIPPPEVEIEISPTPYVQVRNHRSPKTGSPYDALR
jgi:hypothetical protein